VAISRDPFGFMLFLLRIRFVAENKRIGFPPDTRGNDIIL